MRTIGWTATAVGFEERGLFSTDVVSVQTLTPGDVGAESAKESAVGKLMMAHPKCKLLTVVAMAVSVKDEE